MVARKQATTVGSVTVGVSRNKLARHGNLRLDYLLSKDFVYSHPKHSVLALSLNGSLYMTLRHLRLNAHTQITNTKSLGRNVGAFLLLEVRHCEPKTKQSSLIILGIPAKAGQ